MNMCRNITYLLLQLFLFLNIQLIYSQDKSELLKEIISSYNNDLNYPKRVDYKDINLNLVLSETYDTIQNLVSSIQYDIESGKKNGEFLFSPSYVLLKSNNKDVTDSFMYTESLEYTDHYYNLKDINGHVNKGYYDQGILNCEDLELLIMDPMSSNPKYLLKGKVVNGYFDGIIEIYKVSYEKKVEKGVVFSPKYRVRNGIVVEMVPDYELGSFENYTGYYQKSDKIFTLEYEDGSIIDGQYFLDDFSDLYYKSGVLDGFVIRNKEDNSIRDSIIRSNQIWKIDNKFTKNKGWYYGSHIDWIDFFTSDRYSNSLDFHFEEDINKRNSQTLKRRFMGSESSIYNIDTSDPEDRLYKLQSSVVGINNKRYNTLDEQIGIYTSFRLPSNELKSLIDNTIRYLYFIDFKGGLNKLVDRQNPFRYPKDDTRSYGNSSWDSRSKFGENNNYVGLGDLLGVLKTNEIWLKSNPEIFCGVLDYETFGFIEFEDLIEKLDLKLSEIQNDITPKRREINEKLNKINSNIESLHSFYNSFDFKRLNDNNIQLVQFYKRDINNDGLSVEINVLNIDFLEDIFYYSNNNFGPLSYNEFKKSFLSNYLGPSGFFMDTMRQYFENQNLYNLPDPEFLDVDISNRYDRYGSEKYNYVRDSFDNLNIFNVVQESNLYQFQTDDELILLGHYLDWIDLGMKSYEWNFKYIQSIFKISNLVLQDKRFGKNFDNKFGRGTFDVFIYYSSLYKDLNGFTSLSSEEIDIYLQQNIDSVFEFLKTY